MNVRALAFLSAFAVGHSPFSASAQDHDLPKQEVIAVDVLVPSNVVMPELAFEETRRTISNYHKYFYFHREQTEFSEAYSDIQECDLRARALWQSDAVYGLPKERAVDPSDTFLASVSSPLVAGFVASLAAPADARRERRFGLRRCMFFKGYTRHGLSREVFDSFNYEATDNELTETERQSMLAQQAIVASGAQPETESLGL